ncbi:MAG: DinB family protein [Anaerolineae bacterium]|nr:DinB family protein [Anaerolineae bacterium]
MAHPLVEQLRFTRSEWHRGLKDVSAEAAARKLDPMNTIAWIVGHLAWHEQLYWLDRAQGKIIAENVLQCGYGKPASNPPVTEMWDAWHKITEASDVYLDALTTSTLQEHYIVDGKPHPESIGTMLNHLNYHYWYHIGEALAIRQMLGQKDLPVFIGNIEDVPYRPETD